MHFNNLLVNFNQTGVLSPETNLKLALPERPDSRLPRALLNHTQNCKRRNRTNASFIAFLLHY
jgi:hypothetical protein